MNRDEMLRRALSRHQPWDMVIVGGGATGVGVAVDAAARGYEVLLVEQHDFGKGTSSRSTKLVHGGVRYLERGNVSLVKEALRERGLLRQNAPHLVRALAFIVPTYAWWESPFYGLGLKLYNLLSGRNKFGPTRRLTREETLRHLPTIKADGLRGGVVYYDGEFDDARLLVNLVQTAAEQGATVLNYFQLVGLIKDADGFVAGVELLDCESGKQASVAARVVVNATGAFSDHVRRLSDPSARPAIAPSQGTHLVFDRSFLPGHSAIVVPHTQDGRVMFAIPWHGHTLVGTTDVPVPEATLEPVATEAEIDFVLETAGRYLQKPPTRADVLSVFAGIRPLIKAGDRKSTAALSRDHAIHVDHSRLLTISGGKWTTYRNMAEDCVNQAAALAQLDKRQCGTRTLRVHGFHATAESFGHLAVYGSDAPAIQELGRGDPALATPLQSDLPYTGAEVVWAVRFEMARTVEDVLARRTRALFLNARAAMAMAPRVAELMAQELGRDRIWQDEQVTAFLQVGKSYVVSARQAEIART
jgi:glycerol-3-phosphate dehydrogenase